MRVLILSLTILITFFFNTVVESAGYTLWLFIILLGVNIFKEKYVSCLSMFIFGFIYIYYKEFLNDTPQLYIEWGKKNVDLGYQTIICSAVFLILGYYYKSIFVNKQKIFNQNNYRILKKRTFYKINVFLTLFVFSSNIFLIIYGLTKGRVNPFEYGIFSYFSYALCVILIVSWKLYHIQYYNSRFSIKLLICIFPIFVLFIASGTRFLLMYGIIVLVSDMFYELSIKKILKISLFIFLFGLLSNYILEMRDNGFFNKKGPHSYSREATIDLNKAITDKFSNEAILRNAAMITDYSSKNGYTNGQSFGYIFIYVFPRVLWNDKPKMLDYWLIRKYTREYDDTAHSSASGFFGEIYMDFGFYPTMIIMFLFGIFLKKIDNWTLINRNLNFYGNVVAAAIPAWVFFSVRSILTSSFTFIFIIIFSIIISKYFYKHKIITDEKSIR